MSSETLVLSSELSKDTHPENNGGCFTTDLGTPLIFGSDTYIKINDLAYVPNSWNNVRENSNEITLKMRGYDVWGLGPATIYYGGIKWEKGTRKRYTRNTNKEKFRVVDVFRLRIERVEYSRPNYNSIEVFFSDWMPGEPFDGKDAERGTPIFRTLPRKFPWNKWNQANMEIRIPAKAPATSNDWQIGKCYLPCNFYAQFADFQLAFVNCVHEAIEKMLEAGNAHSTVRNLRKIAPNDFTGFSDKVTPPKAVWVFLQEFQWSHWTTVSCIRVPKLFRNATELQIILPPIMEQQLGLIQQPRRLGAIPFTLREQPVAERVWDIDPRHKKPDRWTADRPVAFLSYFNDDRWNLDAEGDSVQATFNFYGINEIDLNRNVVNSLWIFCDIIDGSFVSNVQIPLLQLVPTVQETGVSFERFGMIHRKRINKSRVDAIKIWITETFDGKPLYFREPVTISLEYV